jgi:hypothetical protein
MNWFLTLILISVIISWIYTHKYLEQIDDLKEEFDKKEREYQKEINKLGYQCVELRQKLRSRGEL